VVGAAERRLVGASDGQLSTGTVGRSESMRVQPEVVSTIRILSMLYGTDGFSRSEVVRNHNSRIIVRRCKLWSVGLNFQQLGEKVLRADLPLRAQWPYLDTLLHCHVSNRRIFVAELECCSRVRGMYGSQRHHPHKERPAARDT
jgi:hypothetical protein